MSADLRQILSATLSPNPDVRKSAEHQLSERQKSPAHPLQVLELIANSDAAEGVIRQAAAVHFKNLVKKGWDENSEDGTQGIVISPQDRNTIKTHLVELMCTVSSDIQVQVSEAVSLIAAVDYPEKWDNLLPELIHKFGDTNLEVVNGVLKTANSIFKRFRYVGRSDELYKVIIYTLERIQAPLLAAFVGTGKTIQGYQNDAAQLKARFEALHSMCRIFFSLNYQDLPEYFEDHMQEWMDEFEKYLTYTNPILTDDDEELEPSPIDKLQAAIVENLSLYTSKDEEAFMPFLPKFTTLVWNLLTSLSAYAKHDQLVTKSITFLSSLISKPMHRDLFKDEATLRQIITRIVIPNIMIREVDQERFEDDPHDFLLTEIEGSESDSRRRCTQDLLRAMCRQFEAETTTICSEHVSSMLAEFAADSSKWIAKDAAIQLMLGISIRRESTVGGVSELNENVDVMDFFNRHIFPELQDSNHALRPVVKATCLKFVAIFRVQFSSEQMVALLPLLIKHLTSPVVVVHTFAAYTIERFLVTKDGTDTTAPGPKKLNQSNLKPLLESLFTGLFAIVDNQEWNENDYVMKCLMRSLAVAGQDVVPITPIIFDKLANALGRVCKNPRSPMFNHYLFESIAVLVRSCCSKDASKTNELEALLFPPFQSVLQMQVEEFTPYVFQILAQLLEFRPTAMDLGNSYGPLFQPLLTPHLWETKANVPALVRLIQAYLMKAGPQLVQDNLIGILGIFQKLVASKATEVHAMEHLSSIVLYVPSASLNPYLTEIFKILLTKLQGNRTQRFVRLLSKFFALYIGKVGAQPFFDSLNSVQNGVGLNILVHVWIPHLNGELPTRVDAKIQAVGLTRLLCDTPSLLSDDNGKQIWAQVFERAVALLLSPNFAVREAAEENVDIDISYDATFSGLAYARKGFVDPFPEVHDAAATFVREVHRISTANPGVVSAIIQQVAASDPKLTTGLQSMCQRAGIQLV